MVVDVVALLLVSGIVYLGMFFFTKGADDPSVNASHEEKIYDPKEGINKFNL